MDEEKSTAEQQQQTAQQPPSEGTSEDSKDNNNKEKSKGLFCFLFCFVLFWAFSTLCVYLLPVHILLLPTGGVPIIKKKNFKVDASYTIGQIIQFIKNFIKLEANESIVSKYPSQGAI